MVMMVTMVMKIIMKFITRNGNMADCNQYLIIIILVIIMIITIVMVMMIMKMIMKSMMIPVK